MKIVQDLATSLNMKIVWECWKIVAQFVQKIVGEIVQKIVAKIVAKIV